jgi:lipoprotein-releasing system permease protein
MNFIIPGAMASAFGSMPRQHKIEIGGIFEIGMYEFDKNFVFLDLKKAQQIFSLPQDYCSYWELFLYHPDKVSALVEKLKKHMNPSFHITSWHHSDHHIFQAVEVEKYVMFIILTLIIVIAAFNIISSLTMMVKDKVRDIAILRTLGANRFQILRIFLITGSLIGWLGTFFGLTLGLTLVKNIDHIRQILQKFFKKDLFQSEVYYLSKLPAIIVWSEVWQIVSVSLILALIATLYPAYKASRLDPVEALRL